MQYPLFAVLAAFLFFATLVPVQGAPDKLPDATEQNLMQTRQKMDQLRRQIAELENKAFENHPEILKREQDIDLLIEETARKQGYDMEAVGKKLEALHQRMRSGELAAGEREQLAKQIREVHDAMREAESKLMQDEAVQKARRDYSAAMLSAMAEINPDVESQTEKLRSLSREFRAQMESINRNQGR